MEGQTYEYALRMLFSLVIGAAIGFEREYHTKAAGLRTMIMICLGSTIFAELSLMFDTTSRDRIASTIVTGVGFLGAGVIFKDGLTLSGLTTASTIWITSALGMAVGVGNYHIAAFGLVIVIIVLTLLEKATLFIERLHEVRSYKIHVTAGTVYNGAFEQLLRAKKLRFRKRKDFKEQGGSILVYEVGGKSKDLDAINDHLKKEEAVVWYQY